MDFKTTVSLLYWVVAKTLGHKMTCNVSLNPVMKNDITTKYVCYNWVLAINIFNPYLHEYS